MSQDGGRGVGWMALRVPFQLHDSILILLLKQVIQLGVAPTPSPKSLSFFPLHCRDFHFFKKIGSIHTGSEGVIG